MNILLTCAGRRNYLVQFFKQALQARGQGGEVIACDCSSSAPALADADRRLIVPPVEAPDYFDALLAACREFTVRLVFCVHDLELPGLAREAPRFRAAGTIPVVAAPAVVAACQDKWAAFRYLRSRGIATPDTYPTLAAARVALARGAIRFPLLLKPRWGTSSIGIERVETDRELTLAHEWGLAQMRRTILARMCRAGPERAFVIQQWLPGEEYGLDIINDLAGRYVCMLGRRKLVMRAGNTDRAVTVADAALDQLGATIGRRLRHLGCLDCDVMATDAGYQVLDLNPRFGGGYPFSHLAGADVPAALIAWAGGETPDPSWLMTCPGVVTAKYDGVMTVDPGVPQPVTPRGREPREKGTFCISAAVAAEMQNVPFSRAAKSARSDPPKPS
jgi:carbamoyl-phosphate synthase large subunit